MEKIKKDVVAGPTGTMPNQDLAAFIAMLFWMDDPTANGYKPFGKFADQISAIQTAMQNGVLPKSKLFLNIQAISQDGTLGPLLQTAQMSLGGLMKAIGSAGLWDGCLSVSMDQVAKAAK